MINRSFHRLACEFRISSNDDAFVRRLDSLQASAIQDHPVTETHRFDVWFDGHAYRICEDNRAPDVHHDLEEAVARVDGRLHEIAFEAVADRTKLHAGSGTWNKRRFLVVGDRGAGKTTLMTRLLFEGCAVEGDEMVLLRDGHAIAYPRRFGIRRRTLKLVPQVAPLAAHLVDEPGVEESGGVHVLAFDPIQVGLTWRITAGPVAVLFFLSPPDHGPTRIVPCSRQRMAQRLMTQSAPPRAGSAALIHEIGTLVRDAASYEIVMGDLDSAVVAVREYVAN